jgi:hypothetical protein
MWTSVKVRVSNAGLLAGSQFAFGRSCDRPLGLVSLGPGANVELVPKFHIDLHTSHAALPVVASKFRSDAVNILLHFYPLLHIRKQSTSHRFTLFTPNVLPSIQQNYRQKDGHCLGTFSINKILWCPSPTLSLFLLR